jgi:virginiamycin B lyase
VRNLGQHHLPHEEISTRVAGTCLHTQKENPMKTPLALIAAACLVEAALAHQSTQAAPDQPIELAATVSLHIDGFPDWLAIGFGSLWVANGRAGGVQRIDLETHAVIGLVEVRRPCAAMAVGYDSIWVASCQDRTLVRIDPRTNTVAATIPVGVANSESSVAAGEGGVWLLSDEKGVLTRIDPDTNAVAAQVHVRPNSYAAMAGYGAVWVTNTGKPGAHTPGSVQRIDPRTNEVVATIPVRDQPRFLAVGEGGVWVLNQSDGSVSRIDPKTNEVVATIPVGVPGPGGDIDAGEGAVWVRAGTVLLSVIDPTTNQVVHRFGPPQGSGAVRAGAGAVWISAHDVNRIWRLDRRPSVGADRAPTAESHAWRHSDAEGE